MGLQSKHILGCKGLPKVDEISNEDLSSILEQC